MDMVAKVARAMNLSPSDEEHRAIARAAIEAMRKPSTSMLVSGFNANEGPRSSVHGYIYEAMIDAALRDSE